MSDSQFPILGTSIPPMIGRATILQRMMGALTKKVPDHLQVVGPRFAGKTVILHELADRLRRAGEPYSAVVLWDLGHRTPATDEIFMQCLARELSFALKDSHAEYAEHLRNVQENPYQDVAEVLDMLKDEGIKVLAIMDGFDKPLSNGQLTRNLWDQLRELALKPSLRLITASRYTLRELIRHPDAQTSDFWNIFDPSPVRVGCFNEDDLDAALAAMPNQQLTAGARTELWNATNGFPVFTLGVLNAVCDAGNVGSISDAEIRAACDSAYASLGDKFDALWIDCQPSAQDLVRRLVDEGSVARAGIASVDADTLIDRGFAYSTANKLQRANGLLKKFLDERPNENSAMIRLFGSPESYHQHLKGVLERRIAHIEGIDSTLKRYLQKGIEDFPDYPKVFLSNVHGILEQVLTLIWKAECWNQATGKPRIPSEWFSIWRSNNERNFEDWTTRFPEGGQRLRLLDLITGTQNSDRLAIFVTKNTYVLANSLQGFRDFGVHPKTADIETGTAYAALHICIELAAAVTRELQTRQL